MARKIYVVIKILYFLILISSKGIIYKQLRPRHVLINKLFKIKFLDFGQSKISNIFESYMKNFSIFNILKNKIVVGNLISLIISVLRPPKSIKKVNYKSRYDLNTKRYDYAKPQFYLKDKNNEKVAENLIKMEQFVDLALKDDDRIYAGYRYSIQKLWFFR